jgi:crotonobetainyl-CoA:carnitine CoA-transferase CaiB-like acyl-CoA transferase
MIVLPAVLDDLLVLDLSQGIAGPLCARLLGDYGADVIKVEPPGGDCGRRMPPFFHDDPDPEKSLLFLLTNLNKRGITLDLSLPEGAELFRGLARTADVIVESFPPGYLASLGLDHATLEQDNPGLIMTSITPFGRPGHTATTRATRSLRTRPVVSWRSVAPRTASLCSTAASRRCTRRP